MISRDACRKTLTGGQGGSTLRDQSKRELCFPAVIVISLVISIAAGAAPGAERTSNASLASATTSSKHALNGSVPQEPVGGDPSEPFRTPDLPIEWSNPGASPYVDGACVPLSATWTGGNGNYSQASNWSTNEVPLNDDEACFTVVIPSGKSITYDVVLPDASVADFTLNADSSFYVTADRDYVVQGTGLIGGLVDAVSGIFSAESPFTQFIGNKSRLHASDGGVITIGAQSYSSRGVSNWIWNGSYYFAQLLVAEGADSEIKLPELRTIDAGFDDGAGDGRFHHIAALEGASLDLSMVSRVITPVRGEDWVRFSVGGDLNLSNLRSIVRPANGYGWAEFVIDVPSYSLPLLDSAERTQFRLGTNTALTLDSLAEMPAGAYFSLSPGSHLNLPALIAMQGTGGNDTLVVPAGATLSMPSLEQMNYVYLQVVDGAAVELGQVNDITGSRFKVGQGAEFGSDIVADTYSSRYLGSGWIWDGSYYFRDLLVAEGTGAVLDLSTVGTLDSSFDDGAGDGRYHQIKATAGGTIDLSGVHTITTPIRGEDWVRFSVGGDLNLSNLQSIVRPVNGYGWAEFVIDVPSYSLPLLDSAERTQFRLGTNTALTLDSLAEMPAGAYFSLSPGSHLNLPALIAMQGTGGNDSLVVPAGATLSMPSLEQMNYIYLQVVDGATVELGQVNDITGSRFKVLQGAEFGSDIVADTYSSRYLGSSWIWDGSYYFRDLLVAEGTGAVLDLSTVGTLDSSFDDGTNESRYHQIKATAGGTIDLSGVEVVLTPKRAEDWIQFVAEADPDGNTTLDLSGLTAVTPAPGGSGKAIFRIGGGATMRFGNLTLSQNTNVAMSDFDSTLEVLGSLILDSGTFNNAAGGWISVADDFSLFYTDETKFQCATGILQLNGDGPSSQWFEVAGLDAGQQNPGNNGNFGIGRLIVGTDDQPTTVELVDVINNGNRSGNNPEALYLFGLGGPNGLKIRGGSTLIIHNINVYTTENGQWIHINELFPAGVTEIPYDDGFIALND